MWYSNCPGFSPAKERGGHRLSCNMQLFLAQKEGLHTVSPHVLQPKGPYHMLSYVSKIQLVVYYQCYVLIGCATTRLYFIAHK